MVVGGNALPVGRDGRGTIDCFWAGSLAIAVCVLIRLFILALLVELEACVYLCLMFFYHHSLSLSLYSV